MMKGPQAAAIADGLGGFDWIYLSGVTLSILDQSSRQALIEAVAAARRRGVRIAFDSNYRPRGWSSAEEARRWFAEMWRTTDVALPGLADERAVFGDADGSAVARRLRAQGAVEVAVKDAEQPCLVAVADAEHTVTAESVPTPVDTTAAGDSFNAAYIAARIGGLDPASGARCGHRLAARVIQHPGAVIPRHLMPKDVIR
jgi:2-dehydro-3-deoxygluconokinase